MSEELKIKHMETDLSSDEMLLVLAASKSGKSYFCQDNFEEIEVEDENGVKQKLVRYKGLLSNAWMPKHTMQGERMCLDKDKHGLYLLSPDYIKGVNPRDEPEGDLL